MSYILDALKKSEQERSQGSVPGLHAVHASIGSKTEKRPVWPYLLGLVLLVNVALVLWWMNDGVETEATVTDSDASGAAPVVAAAPVVTVAPVQPSVDTGKVAAEVEQEELAEAESEAPTQPEPATQAHAAVDRTQAAVRGHVAIAETPLTDAQGALLDDAEVGTGTGAVVNGADAAPQTEQPKAEEYVQPVTELPQSIQGKIPAMSYAGHVYSDNPQRRSVLINGRKLREGHVVEGDLVLEEIRLGYSVFSIEGQRFRLEMLRNWPG